MNGDYLYEAMGRIGADLVEVAEKHPFPKSPWRRILPLAACLAVVLGLTPVSYTHLTLPTIS